MQFPELAEHIHGEESNSFSNTLGETITVEIRETQQKTAELLYKVLDGDKNAADILAAEVHKNIVMDDINSQISSCLNLDIPVSNLGVWIDPIGKYHAFWNNIDLYPNSNRILTGWEGPRSEGE